MAAPEFHAYHPNYEFHIEDPDHLSIAPFTVTESTDPIPTLNPIDETEESQISPTDYRKLHALGIAATLEALRASSFGISVLEEYTGLHLFYRRERAGDEPHKDAFFDREAEEKLVARFLENVEYNQSLRMMDIGGMQGGWVSKLSKIAASKGAHTETTVVDLDLTRKPAFVSGGRYDHRRYIEGDAQQLELLAAKFDIPKQDVIMIMHAGEYMFDPIAVYAQAWNQLKMHGYFMLGGSTDFTRVPLWIDVTNHDPFDTLDFRPERVIQKRSMDEYMKIKNFVETEWKQQSDAFIDSLPKTVFQYDSRTDREAKFVEDITRQYLNLPYTYPRFDFGKYLSMRGFSVVESHKPDTSLGGKSTLAYILIQKTSEENPFVQPIMHAGQACYPENLVLPQIHRKGNDKIRR